MSAMQSDDSCGSLPAACETALASSDQPGGQLYALIDAVWRHDLLDSPETATYAGRPEGQDRWRDISPDRNRTRREEAGAPLAALARIDAGSLDAAARLDHELFRRMATTRAEAARFPQHLLALSQMGGPHTRAASVLAMMPSGTRAERERAEARLTALPHLIDSLRDVLAEGATAGVTAPAAVLADVPTQVESLAAPGNRSPYLRPFGDSLGERGQKIVDDDINPALGRLHRFLIEDYLPRARTTLACRDLPDGEAWYRHLVATHTTTDLSPEEIHELGLSEVGRIRAAMDDVIDETGFDGDFAAFCEHLRTDPRFFCRSADELLTRYRDICKQIDPGLPALFRTLPRLPYGVKAVPSYSERSQTTAYYQPGSPEAGRPGWYFANTYDLASRPTWEMEALSLHEAVPGHHLQISLAQELDVPEFRRQWAGWTAYVEGWGLYAESLGPELGLYGDPYSRFGQLTYEMWRAVRLVVDTGIHWLGWTRDQAIELFAANSSKPRHDITVEVDRYIAWPGQALAYKLGEMTITSLRAEAEQTLGEDFDVRDFHDAVLRDGPLPLDLLSERVRAWCREGAKAGGPR
jgi:uncharacterized protein (DUF885 family)